MSNGTGPFPDESIEIFKVRKEIQEAFLPLIEGDGSNAPVRTLQILCLFAHDPSLSLKGASELLAEKGVTLSQERIRQIYNSNEHLVGKLCCKIHPLATTEGRVQELVSILKKRTSKKDAIEVIEQIRKELVGDKVVNSGEQTRIIKVISYADGRRDSGQSLSGPDASGTEKSAIGIRSEAGEVLPVELAQESEKDHAGDQPADQGMHQAS